MSPITKHNDNLYSWSGAPGRAGVAKTSHYFRTKEGSLIIDPVLPEDGNIDAILELGKPDVIAILNETHVRDALAFREKTSAPIYVPKAAAGKVGFEPDEVFGHDDELPGGMRAIHLGHPTESEVALIHYRFLFVADALINHPEKGLILLPEDLCPDSPALLMALQGLLVYEFENLAFGHGTPLLDGALAKLAETLCLF